MQTLFFLLVILVANTIQGITGFAGTLLAMPVGILLLGIDTVRAVLNLLGFASGIGMAVQGRKYIHRVQLGKIIFWMGLGLALGMLLDGLLPTGLLLPAYGCFLIGIAAYKLVRPAQTRLPRGIGEVILIGAGVIHALFISGGSLLVFYVACVFSDKKEFRATLSAVWVVLNGAMLVRHLMQGYFTPEVRLLSVLAFLPMLLGIWLGGRLVNHLQQKPFMILTYCLLMISGLLILLG